MVVKAAAQQSNASSVEFICPATHTVGGDARFCVPVIEPTVASSHTVLYILLGVFSTVLVALSLRLRRAIVQKVAAVAAAREGWELDGNAVHIDHN